MIDIDLTGLPAGRDAEGSTKGYFSGKRGREVASCVVLERLTMTRASVRCLSWQSIEPICAARCHFYIGTGIEPILRHRKDICLRMDAGFWTDDRLDWVLGLGYQVCARIILVAEPAPVANKYKLAEVERVIVGWVPTRTASFVPNSNNRRSLAGSSQAYFQTCIVRVTDLHSSLLDICRTYDLRRRSRDRHPRRQTRLVIDPSRKRLWHAQEMLILLNDLLIIS